MQFHLLGPVEVRDAGRTVPLPRRQQRALLAALLLRAGEVVSTDRLVDELWGEHPPASAVGSLQNAVSQLRKALGPDIVRTQPPGYVLAVDADSVDARRFERLLAESGRQEAAARASTLREALALWRGPALADLADEPWAETEAARLEELRLTALEERIEAELELGRHAALVAQLEALVAEHRLRERLWRQLALALYRSGRQAEALEACRAAAAALDELGLEPSAALRQLERDILQQSSAVAPPAFKVEEDAPAEAAGERRLVSVLAASMPDDEDPDALRAALARVLDATNAAVGRHGGSLERFGPEGLVAVFGADSSREDDALRAVRAGVELSEATGVDVGVATGDAVVAESPRVAGSAVSRAAGLARVGGGVLVDPRTYELVRAAVKAETSGRVARVLEVSAARPQPVHDATFVGRAYELVRLQAAFDAAAAESHCVTACVVGEPGIGKSRLARELVRSLAATVLTGRCAAYGEGATFLPLIEALRPVDSGVADDELVVKRIADLGGAAGEPGSLGESYWAVRRLLEAVARERPVALILDDVHWAEPALLDLVEYLRDRVGGAPLFVLCLARPELFDERPGWAADALRLEPLAAEDMHELVASSASVEDVTRDRIVDLAEGNPLYAQQLAAYAAESGKALEPGAMPATIDAVLAGRLGRLDAGERATLQRAAVVGREFSRGAVAAVAPPDLAVDAHLLALTRRGFVRAAPDASPGDDAYRFHHVLLRDAAYATLTKEQRADLHEKVAAWLDHYGSGDDALVGYHLEQAAALLNELGAEARDVASAAGDRLALAGMRMWSAGDTLATIGLLERAVGLLSDQARRSELFYELSVASRLVGRRDASDAHLARAVADAQAADNVPIVARAELEAVRLLLHTGEVSPEEVVRTAESTIAVLEKHGDDRGLGRAWLAVVDAENFRCRNDATGEAAARAETYYRRIGFSTASSLLSQAAALYHGTTPAARAAQRCLELLDQPHGRAGRANVIGALAALNALTGELNTAAELLLEAQATYEDLDMRMTRETVWAHRAFDVARLSGAVEDAAAIARASLHSLQVLGEPAWAATRAVQLADVLVDLNELDEASTSVRLARTSASRHDVLVAFMVRRVEARLAARAGAHEGARALARQAVEIADSTDDLSARADTWLARAEVALAAGEATDAASASAEALRLYKLKGNVPGEARVRAIAPSPQTA